MKITLKMILVGTFIAALLFQGCVASSSSPKITKSNAEKVFQSYMAKGKALSDQGNYPEALIAYDLALAIVPADSAAQEGKSEAQSALIRQAENYYQQGIKLEMRGRFKAAKQRYLAALRLWPEHKTAMEKLKMKHRPSQHPYIMHTIKQGESLSLISKRYYGSLKHYDVIARFNGIEDVTQIRVGQKIKVPRVKDLTFSTKVDLIQPVTVTEEIEDKQVEVETDQTDIYREQGIALFTQKEYHEAAFEFLKVHRAKPEDGEIKDYLSKCYFEQGNQMMGSSDYNSAKENYELALSYDPKCTLCSDRLTKTSNRIKEHHYRQGIEYFEQQQPEQAITEWQKVEVIDPAYKQVKSLIKRAQIIVDKLENIKKFKKK